jgi:hypothetical protein
MGRCHPNEWGFIWGLIETGIGEKYSYLDRLTKPLVDA